MDEPYRSNILHYLDGTPPHLLHEGVRQSFLKAVEISIESGKLGDGDKSDLLGLYTHLWPNAPRDIRVDSLRAHPTVGACGE